MAGSMHPVFGMRQARKWDKFREIIPLMGEALKDTPPRRKNIEQIVAENIETLIARAPEGHRTTLKFAKYVGVGNGTIDRLRKGDAAARISTLAKVAARFRLEPWHLLIDGMQPAAPPHVLTPSETALYAKFETLMGDLKSSGYEPPDDPGVSPRAIRAELPKHAAHRYRKRK